MDKPCQISCRSTKRKRGRKKRERKKRGRRKRRGLNHKRLSDDDDDDDDGDNDRDDDIDNDSDDSDDSDEGRRGKKGNSGLESLTMGFVINTSKCRGMRKIVVEVARATLFLYKIVTQDMSYEFADDMLYWEAKGENMVVFFTNNYKRLSEIQKNAEIFNIPVCCVSKRGYSRHVCHNTLLLALFSTEEILNRVAGDLEKLTKENSDCCRN